MKKIGYSILAVLAIATISCDKVNNAYYGSYIPSNATVINYSPNTSGYQSKVLLEDYTGFRCTNCPPATATATQLEENSNGRVIVMGVHCTDQFAAPIAAPPAHFSTDFRTSAGNTWLNTFPIYGLPSGMVNRHDFGSGVIIQAASWEENINSYLTSTSPIIYLGFQNVTFNSDTSQVGFDVIVKPLQTITANYNLTVCLLESNIIEAQKSGTEIIYPYTHNHVLRGSLNGAWGQPALSSQTVLANGYSLSFHFNLTLKDSNGNLTTNPNNLPWMIQGTHPSDLSLVAFVANADTREIAQVEKYPFH